VKISPPLVITEEAILESTAVLEEAFAEALVSQAAIAALARH
jgi:4-aminobutyrate aminotransferase-like enzyme